MAGRLGSCRFCRAGLAVMTVAFAMTILGVTGVWSPLPVVDTFLTRLLSLSKPEPAWNTRAPGDPDTAAVMRDGTVVVTSRGFVNGYRGSDGQQLWQFPVNWTVLANDVVVAQQRPLNPDEHPPTDGYSVIDPSSGTVLWGDDKAIAAWGFAGSILDLVCPGAGNCQVRSHPHRESKVSWTVDVPERARFIKGANPTLAGTRDPAEWFAQAAAGTPGPIPAVFALPVDGKVQLIDTFRHVLTREVAAPDKLTRVAASGDSVLFVHAQRASSGCVYRVEAINYFSGESRWKQEGYDLDTASGAGCEQRRDPLGADRHLVVTNTANAPMIVGADSGQPEWTGVAGQKVLAAGYGVAVVASQDRKTVQVLDVLAVPPRVTWTGEMGLEPEAAVTAEWVIIRDGDAGRLLVFSRFGMAPRLEISTKADVIGYGPAGILIADGRRVGLHPLQP